MNYPTEMQQKMAAASAYSVQGIGTSALSQHSENPSRPSTEIEGCLDRANSALERLHGRIGAVEDRVRPVMRGISQGKESSTGKPQEALSPLGDAITSIENRIGSAVDRLEALLLGLAL